MLIYNIFDLQITDNLSNWSWKMQAAKQACISTSGRSVCLWIFKELPHFYSCKEKEELCPWFPDAVLFGKIAYSENKASALGRVKLLIGEANDLANIHKECQAAEVEVGSNGMEMSRAYCSQGGRALQKDLTANKGLPSWQKKHWLEQNNNLWIALFSTFTF